MIQTHSHVGNDNHTALLRLFKRVKLLIHTRTHIARAHTHTQTSCYSSVGHRLGILWKNMIGVIPTLRASSPHIFFWPYISRGSRPVWVPVGPPGGPEGSWRGETWTASSQEPSLIVHAIVVGRKLWGAPWLSWHRGSAVEKHWIIMAHYAEKTLDIVFRIMTKNNELILAFSYWLLMLAWLSVLSGNFPLSLPNTSLFLWTLLSLKLSL